MPSFVVGQNLTQHKHLFSQMLCVRALFDKCFFSRSSRGGRKSTLFVSTFLGLKIHRRKLYQRYACLSLCGGRQRRRCETTHNKEEDEETNCGGSSRFCIFLFCAVVAPYLRFFLRFSFSRAFLRARLFSIFVSCFWRWLPHRSF